MRRDIISVISAALLVVFAGSKTQPIPARNSCPIIDQSKHLIAPGDTLTISGLGTCTWPQIVPANGKIVIPLVGEIQVLDLTSTQLAQLLKEPLSKYLNNPLVRISVEDGQKYYVDGEVNHPGSFCLDTPTTVLEALEISGGLRKQANSSNIRIIRGSQVLRFNYKEALKGKHPEQNISIEKGDHLIVL